MFWMKKVNIKFIFGIDWEYVWNRFGINFEDWFKYFQIIILGMDILDIATLKKIIEKVPEDFDLEFDDRNTTHKISDKVEIDVGEKKLILKIYWFV